jgi:hypothetical protein
LTLAGRSLKAAAEMIPTEVNRATGLTLSAIADLRLDLTALRRALETGLGFQDATDSASEAN